MVSGRSFIFSPPVNPGGLARKKKEVDKSCMKPTYRFQRFKRSIWESPELVLKV